MKYRIRCRHCTATQLFEDVYEVENSDWTEIGNLAIAQPEEDVHIHRGLCAEHGD